MGRFGTHDVDMMTLTRVAVGNLPVLLDLDIDFGEMYISANQFTCDSREENVLKTSLYLCHEKLCWARRPVSVKIRAFSL